jgi:REP element-mobilizing transposase RayT
MSSLEKTMNFTHIGSIAHQYWCDIPTHFPFVELDAFIIMPNHVHGIIIINKTDNGNVVETQNFASLQGSQQNSGNKFGPQSQNLASIIRGYKTGVKKYATMHHIDFTWQSRFHDHVIRDYLEYISIQDYINNNPAN